MARHTCYLLKLTYPLPSGKDRSCNVVISENPVEFLSRNILRDVTLDLIQEISEYYYFMLIKYNPNVCVLDFTPLDKLIQKKKLDSSNANSQ